MLIHTLDRTTKRRGVVAPYVAILTIPLMAMIAFAVDIGYIKVAQNQAQNAADAAALAGTGALMDRRVLQGELTQSQLYELARDAAQANAEANEVGNRHLTLLRNSDNDPQGEIVIGRISQPSDRGQSMTFGTSPYNSVQVRVRKNAERNGGLALFFAPLLGFHEAEIQATATATYEDGITGFRIPSGETTIKLFPFALEEESFLAMINRESEDAYSYNPDTGQVTSGGDGISEAKLFPAHGTAPGNFGTVNIGPPNNSTNTMKRQILHGPNQGDLDYMGGKVELNDEGFLWLNGNTGVSAGFESELKTIIGQTRIIPIYRAPVIGNGNNAQFKIVHFAGVAILDVNLRGALRNKHITIQPEFVIEPGGYSDGRTGTSTYTYYPLRLTR